MKARNLCLIVFCAVLVGAAGIGWAVSPHFIDSKTTATVNSDGCLVVKFKEAGLGSNEKVQYELTATVDATWNCVNKGGNCPKASNKTTSSKDEDLLFTATSGKNGTVSATAMLAPTPPEDFSCPGNQKVAVSEVTYTDILLVDETNNLTANLPDSIGPVTLFVCP